MFERHGTQAQTGAKRPRFVNFPTPDVSQGLPGFSAPQKTLNGDKVYPGRAGTDSQGHQEPAALPGQQPLDGRQLRLIPDLSAAALRRKKHQELALWYRLRALDQPAGKGIMSTEVAIQGLIETFAYSLRTAYRQLDLAEGRLWRRGIHRKGPVIEIYGLKRACEYLGTCLTQSDRHFRELPTSQFQLGQERAQLYASTFKPQGIRANPISRQSIEEYTGLDKCQQLRLEKKARVRKTNGHGVLQVNGRIIPERQLIVTKKKQYETNKRLPNIYHSQAKPSNRGMLKRVGSKLKARSLIPDEAASTDIPTKRYFTGHKALLQAVRAHFRKEHYLPFEGYRLVRNSDRLIKGRIEWCREVICA